MPESEALARRDDDQFPCALPLRLAQVEKLSSLAGVPVVESADCEELILQDDCSAHAASIVHRRLLAPGAIRVVAVKNIEGVASSYALVILVWSSTH